MPNILQDKTPLTYISLFSCAGVGCYGFKMEGFSCVASVELNQRRLNVQKFNQKCKYSSGYICGDMTADSTKNLVFAEIDRWKRKEKLKKLDVLVATPPCQGISVQNHKKKDEINRNSLVVESVEMVDKIRPKVFVFENVMAFEKTLCITKDERIMPIGEYIREALGENYVISSRILNFMNYGSNSSRTRTLVIGVDKAYRETITPYDLFPAYQKEKTLREVVGDFPVLEWGEISKDDFYHAFRTYDVRMRDWIHDLKEGESAFDNADPLKRPHKLVDGEVVENIRKNRDKYTRQKWDRFIQCVHTRNDQLAAQNTVHPEQDRVFSIRELMTMMNIPETFNWVDRPLEVLNAMSDAEKRKLYKEHETNIRQCLGEAVPTIIMQQIAHNIKTLFGRKLVGSAEINKIIESQKLVERQNLLDFLDANPLGLDVPSLMRITELCNAEREKNAAFYTNKFLVNDTVDKLPDFTQPEIRIIEPSGGAGSFVPFLIKKYAYVPHVILDIVDIDPNSIANLKLLLKHIDIPENFTINLICSDFLYYDSPYRYDLAVGNPPFSKLKQKARDISFWFFQNVNQDTNDLAEMFLEKCMFMADCVALILNKNILSGEEFFPTHNLLRKVKIDSIIDFGRHGFTGVSIETICLIVYPKQKPDETTVYNMKYNKIYHQKQSYITDKKYPYFIIYRDADFDRVADKLDFNVFTVFRDRQITKQNSTKEDGDSRIWVIKGRNIDDDAKGITHIPEYDTFIDISVAKELNSYIYVNDSNVYLTPNMTYNTRVIKNIPNVIADGSVAVLIPRQKGMALTDAQMAYFSSDEYRKFYITARNLSTQSINVDKCSVYFYGILKNDSKSIGAVPECSRL
jgi:DNA (cytosine-5)-methyltransferase 1